MKLKHVEIVALVLEIALLALFCVNVWTEHYTFAIFNLLTLVLVGLGQVMREISTCRRVLQLNTLAMDMIADLLKHIEVTAKNVVDSQKKDEVK